MKKFNLPSVIGPELDAIIAGLRLLAREVANGNVRADDGDIGGIWAGDRAHDEGLPVNSMHSLADRLNFDATEVRDGH